MRDGRLQQLGTYLELYDRPANRFVATFVGEWPMNTLPAEIGVDSTGAVAVVLGGAHIPLTPRQASLLGGCCGALPTEIGVRPEDFILSAEHSDAGLNGRVLIVEPQGDRAIVVVETAAGRVSAIVGSDVRPLAEQTVGLSFVSERAQFFTVAGANVLYGFWGSGP